MSQIKDLPTRNQAYVIIRQLRAERKAWPDMWQAVPRFERTAFYECCTDEVPLNSKLWKYFGAMATWTRIKAGKGLWTAPEHAGPRPKLK